MLVAENMSKEEMVKEAVEEATGYDHYFDPEESLKFGLVDEIADFNRLMEEC